MKTLIASLLFGSTVLLAQPERLVFEVASVKPNRSIDGTIGASIQPSGRVVFTRISLRDLIWVTYGTSGIQGPDQIVGGPSWLGTDHFDIDAKAEGDIKPDAQGRRSDRLNAMLKSLIEDRFNVRAHVETRETQTYALVLSNRNRRLGPRMHVSTVECAVPPALFDRVGWCGLRVASAGVMVARGVTMEQVAATFSNRGIVNRPVRNGTGLSGRFDFDLEFMPATPGPNPESSDDKPDADFSGALFTSVQEQLGLKLQREKGVAQFLVIDHVEHPAEN